MKIVGNTVGTPMKRPDFNQKDPKKSDYIKNNPIPDIKEEDEGKIVQVSGGAYVLNDMPKSSVDEDAVNSVVDDKLKPVGDNVYKLIALITNNSWRLKDTFDGTEDFTYDFEFVSNGTSYSQISYIYQEYDDGSDNECLLRYRGLDGRYTIVYRNGWLNEDEKLIIAKGSGVPSQYIDSFETIATRTIEESAKALNTDAKTILGAINELKSRIGSIPIVKDEETGKWSFDVTLFETFDFGGITFGGKEYALISFDLFELNIDVESGEATVKFAEDTLKKLWNLLPEEDREKLELWGNTTIANVKNWFMHTDTDGDGTEEEYDNFGDAANAKIQKVVSDATKGLNDITNWMGGVVNDAGEAVADFGEAISVTIENANKDTQTWINGLGKDIGNWFEETKNNTEEGITNFGEAVTATIDKASEGTKNGLEQVVTFLAGTGEVAEDFAEKAVATIAGIGEEVVESTQEGLELVQGWINDITSFFGGITWELFDFFGEEEVVEEQPVAYALSRTVGEEEPTTYARETPATYGLSRKLPTEDNPIIYEFEFESNKLNFNKLEFNYTFEDGYALVFHRDGGEPITVYTSKRGYIHEAYKRIFTKDVRAVLGGIAKRTTQSIGDLLTTTGKTIWDALNELNSDTNIFAFFNESDGKWYKHLVNGAFIGLITPMTTGGGVITSYGVSAMVDLVKGEVHTDNGKVSISSLPEIRDALLGTGTPTEFANAMITNLKKHFTVASDLEGLQGEVNTLKGTVEGIQGDIEGIEGDVADIQSDVGDVDELESTVKGTLTRSVNYVHRRAENVEKVLNWVVDDLDGTEWIVRPNFVAPALYGKFVIDADVTDIDATGYERKFFANEIRIGYEATTDMASEGYVVLVTEMMKPAISNTHTLHFKFFQGDTTNPILIDWLTTYGEMVKGSKLETEAKDVFGAINELNGKTIDKIEEIYVAGDPQDISVEDGGIVWENFFTINRDNTGDFYHRVPIVAGDNVTFEVEGNVVKINAQGGGSTSKAIIDVVELPTENINEEAFYRLLSAKWVSWGEVYNALTCHCVETLPDTAIPATTDMVNITAYYNASDGGVYGYVDDMLAGYFGIPSGWYSAEMLFQTVGWHYGGVITDIKDSDGDVDFKVLLGYTLYTHKDGKWETVKGVGTAGTGVNAEVFNDTDNEASGDYSQARGAYTKAKGYASTAEGECTVATARNQHVQGQFNIEDTEEKYAHIVGNGEDGADSNAHTIDWQGNGWFAGTIKVGGTGQDDEEAKELATKEYVDSKTGGSSVSLIGTWTVVDEPTIPIGYIPLTFTANGEEYVALNVGYMGSSSWGITTLAYCKNDGEFISVYTNNPSGSYGITHGWGNQANRQITVTEEPTDKGAIAWLGANTDAPKVEAPKEEMPQIRFTSMAQNETLDGYKFTVEIVGGGALQEGDALQICGKRMFGQTVDEFGNIKTPKKYKLRRFAEYTISADDLEKRFLTVNVKINTRTEPYLFRSNNKHSLPLSPLYLRIRRPKGYLQNNDTGMTVDATFSNIVTVWKTYDIEGMEISLV